MSKSPTVSVVIPVYNKREQIEPTIQSVFEQTYQDFEIVVVDDGSTDGSREVLQDYGDRIHFHPQENAGPSNARNTGIELANGKYVAFLDADDIWNPEKLETQMSFLESHPELVWSASNYINCNEFGEQIGIAREGLSGDWTIFENWFQANTGKYMILTSGVIVRRNVFDIAGMFDEEIPAGQDVEMWMRIAQFAPRYAYCNLPLFEYLQLPASVSKASVKKFESNALIIEKHIGLCSEDATYSEFLRAETEKLIKSSILFGIPSVNKRLFKIVLPEWESPKLRVFRMLSKLPASWQRMIAKLYLPRKQVS